ncbi:MAG: glycosyltransferase family 39 protein [Candidatus Aminicenantes bacterium]|nr:glycosyltransferase family 39 protein [Candidatus Aminicenantes bacterium]
MKRLPALLRALTGPLYLLLVFYWFKDNFPPLKPVPGGPLLPALLLAGVLIARLVLTLRGKKLRLRRPGRDALLLAALLLLAVAVRVPYFVHGAGLVTSDDAIPALMGKHIAEGRIAPVSYYGQLYMGSLSSHWFAVFFKLFGYSVFVLQLATLLFYLGFMAGEYLFLKELFDRTFALLVTLFLALPIGELVRVSFDDTSAYPLVLLFGTFLLFLAHRIAWKGEERRLAAFGFLTGLAFWTHQVTAGFILTAWLAVLLRVKPGLKRYAILASTTLVGLFPLLMQEVDDRFHMIRFLTAGEKSPMSVDKLSMTASFIRHLLIGAPHALGFIFVAVVFAGFVVLAVRVVRRPEARPQALFVVFFALFFGVFIASGFSAKGVVRYLFPAYVCLPVLFLAGAWLLSGKRRVAASLALMALLAVSNIWSARAGFRATRDRAVHTRRVVAAMEVTGVRYWQADYWNSYRLTAVAGERVVVHSNTVKRYVPYRLAYYNEGRRGAFVFVKNSPDARRGAALVTLLEGLGVPHKSRMVDGTRLVYAVDSQVFSPLFFDGFIKANPPPLPALEVEDARPGRGFLRLTFAADQAGVSGFRVRAAIPPVSSQTRLLSPETSDNQFRLALAKAGPVEAAYSLDYFGLEIPATRRTLTLPPPAKPALQRRERVVFLKGVGPKTAFFGTEMRVLEKEVRVELNRLKKKPTRLRLGLYSPMEFEHTYWYGDYTQRMTALVNGVVCAEIALRDKDNACLVEVGPERLRAGRNTLTLKFDYHLPLIFAPLTLTACLLESLEVEQDGP